MRYLVAVIGALVLAIVFGFGGFGYHLSETPHGTTGADLELYTAKLISEGSICSIVLALVFVPALIALVYRRSKMGSDRQLGG